MKYLNLIQDYKKDLELINLEIKKFNCECVFNEELLIKRDKIRAIVVMDNPGVEEREQKKYLVGTAGKAFNKVWDEIGLNREEVLILNKTSFTTPATLDLNKIYLNPILKEIFLKENRITFNLIKSLQRDLDVPILVHGYAAYLKNNKKYINNEKGGRPLYLFFNLLSNLEGAKKFTYFYKHSSYGNLSKQVKKFSIDLGVEKLNFNQYLKLGEKNIAGFFN